MSPEQLSLGGWCHLASPFSVELMASVGFDWCCLDMQHGTIRINDVIGALQGVRAAGGTAYVRVPGVDAALIGAVLDAGADGVFVPQVSTAEQARAVVRACRYSPDGARSWGPLRPKLTTARPDPAVLAGAPCYVMVEDRAGVENVAAITAVPGVTGVLAGPADLALDLFGDPYLASDPRTVDALTPVVAACRDNAITAGVFCGAGNVDRWQAAGFAMLAVESDTTLLLTAARRAVADARAQLDRV
ncbi:aldolase [Pseudonocardia sulfidoxydans NBRC 16205]|uniref:Aldolase n=1 Tax=Pseudonocardia sulfidoxydans NBRC 16205 TaxID=1223511 RepID=A0A511DBN8_9PSEU|nr:aldolase/citrate lyase family protein [Pseudonocardia sulfidoxydans]GEL22212.1 aldolase [Pseudonocardia sulfidoxydans NBRC 16205]